MFKFDLNIKNMHMWIHIRKLGIDENDQSCESQNVDF